MCCICLSTRTKKKLKEFHTLLDDGEKLALEGVVNAAVELRERWGDDAVKERTVLEVAVHAARAKRKLRLVAQATGLDRKCTHKHLARQNKVGPREFKWVTYNRKHRSDTLAESTCRLVR